MNPVPDRVLGPALGLPVLLGLLARLQLLDGQAFVSGLANTRRSRVFGDLGLVEQALPVMARAFFSPRQGRGQSLPIAFALEALGGDFWSGRGRTAPSLPLQGLARLFGDGIQLPLFLFGAQASRRGHGHLGEALHATPVSRSARRSLAIGSVHGLAGWPDSQTWSRNRNAMPSR